jgi:site-specific recombinase XerD
LNNAKVNEEIKVVAEVAGLDKHLTCHVGRHSFGTNMAVKIPVTMLQVYMGHSKIETTMQYVHMSRKIQDDVMEQIRWEK